MSYLGNESEREYLIRLGLMYEQLLGLLRPVILIKRDAVRLKRILARKESKLGEGRRYFTNAKT